MASKMLHHVANILKAVRKGQKEKVSYHACMTLSWALGMANRFHLNIEEEVWKRFPGVCPYCNQEICVCGKRRPKNRKQVKVDPRLRPSSCHGYQLMFAKIYPQTLAEAASHLAEEVSEVDQAIRHYIGMHKEELFQHAVLELVDVVTTLFAVANNVKFDLAIEMEQWFADGCPGCGKSPCDCKYEDTVEELGGLKAKPPKYPKKRSR